MAGANAPLRRIRLCTTKQSLTQPTCRRGGPYVFDRAAGVPALFPPKGQRGDGPRRGCRICLTTAMKRSSLQARRGRRHLVPPTGVCGYPMAWRTGGVCPSKVNRARSPVSRTASHRISRCMIGAIAGLRRAGRSIRFQSQSTGTIAASKPSGTPFSMSNCARPSGSGSMALRRRKPVSSDPLSP
jgi:hypothetical protein